MKSLGWNTQMCGAKEQQQNQQRQHQQQRRRRQQQQRQQHNNILPDCLPMAPRANPTNKRLQQRRRQRRRRRRRRWFEVAAATCDALNHDAVQLPRGRAERVTVVLEAVDESRLWNHDARGKTGKPKAEIGPDLIGSTGGRG
jgi:hypothetical protein